MLRKTREMLFYYRVCPYSRRNGTSNEADCGSVAVNKAQGRFYLALLMPFGITGVLI
jgi:hypothetical protein